MHISELIAEQQLDELSLAGIGQGIGKVANTVGKVAGNVQGAYQGAKDAFNQGRAQTAPIAQRNVSRGAQRVRTAPADNQQTPQPTPQPTPQAEPQGQAVDLDQVKQQSADQQAQGQADQQQAMQQMQATAQANQASAINDAEIKKAADDAKAKPASLQTLSDRLAIKLAASKGIHENKKNRAVVEFHSKFLGQLI
jgi:hypothetical protein